MMRRRGARRVLRRLAGVALPHHRARIPPWLSTQDPHAGVGLIDPLFLPIPQRVCSSDTERQLWVCVQLSERLLLCSHALSRAPPHTCPAEIFDCLRRDEMRGPARASVPTSELIEAAVAESNEVRNQIEMLMQIANKYDTAAPSAAAPAEEVAEKRRPSSARAPPRGPPSAPFAPNNGRPTAQRRTPTALPQRGRTPPSSSLHVRAMSPRSRSPAAPPPGAGPESAHPASRVSTQAPPSVPMPALAASVASTAAAAAAATTTTAASFLAAPRPHGRAPPPLGCQRRAT